jgi:hypothetical protein
VSNIQHKLSCDTYTDSLNPFASKFNSITAFILPQSKNISATIGRLFLRVLAVFIFNNVEHQNTKLIGTPLLTYCGSSAYNPTSQSIGQKELLLWSKRTNKTFKLILSKIVLFTEYPQFPKEI